MTARRTLRIGILFEQFAAYHVDRIQAVARRLDARAELIAVEVASSSRAYAWQPSGEVEGVTKMTLFPRQNFEDIGLARRWWAQIRALWHCDVVLVGVGYGHLDIIALSWFLRLLGVRLVLLNDSKFDDRPREALGELGKTAILTCYHAAIVAGQRHMAYLRFLGFRRRPILPGFDCVDADRVRAEGKAFAVSGTRSHAARQFIFVGRFVPKKNLATLLEAFAIYLTRTKQPARRLQLVGAGQLEPELRGQCDRLGITELVEFTGFLSAGEVSARLAASLALVLPSTEEQWGLVVNEAVAAGLPVIVSTAAGSRDLLVRSPVNGFVFEPVSSEGLAAALTALADDEALWAKMSTASLARSWLGDSERFADAVQCLIEPEAAASAENIASLITVLRETNGGEFWG